MIIQNIDIPDDLLKAFEENRVVVFAGAGVSMQSPSNCPSFSELSDRIAGIKIYQHTPIIHNLNTDSELFSKFTAIQVGRVILLMLNHYSPDAQWILHGVDNLFKKKISPHIEQRLSQEICKTGKQCGISIEPPK